MTLSLDKTGATRIARNLATHLKSAHGLDIGHQTAMTALAAALGYRSLHAFVQDAKSGPPATLDAFGQNQLVDTLRTRGCAVCAVNPREAARMAGVDPDSVKPTDLSDWFAGIHGHLEASLHKHAGQVAARAYDPDDSPFENADTDRDRSEDLPDGQVANADHGRDKVADPSDLESRALDQCTHRDIQIEKQRDGYWVWYMPDSKNPAKRVPGVRYASEGEAARAACAAFGIDPTVFCVLNHYSCPDCDMVWEDPWFCSPDDACPSCGCDIEPAEIESLVMTDTSD